MCQADKDLAEMRFIFEGCLLNAKHTPLALEMEDGDQIQFVSGALDALLKYVITLTILTSSEVY